MTDKLVLGTDGFFSVYLRGFQDKTNDEIKEIFNEFGDVVYVKQVNDNHFVRYTRKEEAQKAIEFFANNHKVIVAPGINHNYRNKKGEANSARPRNFGQDQNNMARNNRNWNGEDHMKSPPHDRQFYGHNRNGHNQESEKSGWNFQHDQRENRNEQLHNPNKQRTLHNGFNDHNEGFGDKRGGRKSGEFNQNKQEFGSPRNSNFQNKSHLSNGFSNNTERFERRGNNDNRDQPNWNGRNNDKDLPNRSSKGNGNKDQPKRNGRNSVQNDIELPLLAAQEVIIADLPSEMMQGDLFKLCNCADPLHIDLHKIEEDSIIYAHVFVKSRKDVDTLVENLNGLELSNKKIVVMSVEKMLSNKK